MARPRPSTRDHEAVVMDVGDPREPSDQPSDRDEVDADDPPLGGLGGATTMAPVSMDADTPESQGSEHDPRRPWPVPTVVVVVVAGLGLAGWTLLADPTVEATPQWSAPTVAVAERWSMAGSGFGDLNTTQVQVIGDDVVVSRTTGRGPDTAGRVPETAGRVLERRDGRTGEVEWSSPGLPGALVAVVDGNRPLPRLMNPAGPIRRIVGVSAATGDQLWRQAANEESWGGTTPTGDLWVMGDRGCGIVQARTGRFIFTVGERLTRCGASGDGLVWENDGEFVVFDRTGDVAGRVPATAGDPTWPLLHDDAVVHLDGDVLVSRDPSGVERWQLDLGDGPWWWMQDVGNDLLFVAGERTTVLVRHDDGTIVGRVAGQPDPFVTAQGRVRLLLDRSRMSAGEQAGVWSESPDAATFALLDGTGQLLGTQDVVPSGWPVPTAHGVLMTHGPDDARRMALFDGDDFSVVWEVPVQLREGTVVASSSDLVVLHGFEEGDTRLVVYGPEG